MNDQCYTCRRRRIQCDQSGIPCSKCFKSGLECFQKRPLRWVKGVTLHCKSHGSVLRPSLQTKYMPNKPLGRTENVLISTKGMPSTQKSVKSQYPLSHDDEQSSCRANNRNHTENLSSKLVVAPAYCSPHLVVSNDDRTSRYYLDYYNERICKLFIVQDSEKNPLRTLISLAVHDSVLMNAVLALAARHHANTSRSFYQHGANEVLPVPVNANRDALLFKYKAIQGLTSSVEHFTSSNHDTILASIFLLIFLDLLESGSDRWNVHLEGAKTLMTSNRSLFELSNNPAFSPGITVQDIRDFIGSQIYLIGTLGGTFVRPKLLTQFPGLQQTEVLSQDTVERSFLGCPVYLLNAIQSVSARRDTIAELKAADDRNIWEQRQSVELVMESIHRFDCHKWAAALPHRHDPSDEELMNLCLLASSYKLGALIYAHRVLDACTGEECSPSDLLGELIMTIGSLQTDDMLFKCILWPIFVAGLESRWEAQKQFIMQCLEKFWNLTLCLNVINAADILRIYWERNHQHDQPPQWIFNMGRLGQDWLLI